MKSIRTIGLVLMLLGITIFSLLPFAGHYRIDNNSLKETIKDSVHRETLIPALGFMKEKEYSSSISFVQDFRQTFKRINNGFKEKGEWDKVIWKDYTFDITKNASSGIVKDNSIPLLLIITILSIIGSFCYIIPSLYIDKEPGIKNNGVFHKSISSRGIIGIITGALLVSFYIALYWYPEYIVNWVIIIDPISVFLSGNPASQWFLYGLLYTVVMITMGTRMLIKYRHSKYQIIRTISVIFFQTCFAFLIPEILVRLNKPYFDFKNMWPLDYDFFFKWHIEGLLESGKLGIFMLVWGIILFVLGVPIMVYFFGKRWYCSWVCGCGGLAETLGDPFRQLSDKSLRSWKIERWMIHSVLVFAIIMTVLTLVNFFYPNTFLSTYANSTQKIYGFLIGSAFAGVVGTGFYPLMGNRVWCRFGCPLAAYLGFIQRFKSRFRITTNGGQCISCGNCSTYCEMGIDVRWYAQRGQNIVRSSCVGCGICSAVCPRGVLNLENLKDTSNRTGLPEIILGRKE